MMTIAIGYRQCCATVARSAKASAGQEVAAKGRHSVPPAESSACKRAGAQAAVRATFREQGREPNARPYLPEQGGPVLHGLPGAVDAIMRPARKYHLVGRVGVVGSPADQAGRARTMRAAHISARPDDLMTAGPLRDVTVVSGAVPGRARVNEQRAGMPALGGMSHG